MKYVRNLSTCFVVIGSMLLIGCGGSDGGSTTTTVTAETASVVEISFPGTNSVMESDSVTVTGYFSGNPAIVVNGQEARFRGNAWFAQIALTEGDNLISVEVDGSPFSELNVTRKVLISRIQSMTVSGSNSTVNLSNSSEFNYEIPVSTKVASEIAFINQQSSTYRPTVSVRDDAQNRIVGVDYRGSLHSFDMSTGTRSQLSYYYTTAGAWLINLRSIAVGSTESYISMNTGIYSLNKVTGDRVLFSEPEANIMSIALDMELDSAGNRILAIENGSAQNLLAISTNVATPGVKTVLMDATTATAALGISWAPTKLSFDSLNNFAYLLQSNAIIKVDLNTTPVTVSNLFSLTGTPGSLVVSPDGTKLYYTDSDTLYLIDLSVAPLAAQVYSSPTVGAGTTWASSKAVEISADGTSVFVLESNYVYKVAQTGDRVRSHISTTEDIDMNGTDLFTGLSYQIRKYAEAQSATAAVGAQTVVADNTYKGIKILQNVYNLSVLGNDAFVASPNAKAVIGVDLTTGARRYLTDDYTNDVATNYMPSSFSIANGVGYAFDASAKALYSIDLTTGARTVVSQFSQAIGSGNEFGNNSIGLAVDPTSNLAFIADNANLALISVDLASGNRTLVSDATVGTGIDYGFVDQIAFDTSSAKVLVLDSANNGIISIDPTNGNREVFRSFKVGNGPLVNINSIEFNGAEGDLYYLDNESILRVSPATGNREIAFSNDTGSGPLLNNPIDMVMDSTRNRILILERDQVNAIDLTTGERSYVSAGDNVVETPVGIGENFDTSLDYIALDEENGRIFVGQYSHSSTAAVWLVDAVTGDRTIIASSTVGTGTDLSYPRSAIYNSFDSVLYIGNNNARELMEINLETGVRTIIVSRDLSYSFGNMVMDEQNAYLYMSNNRVYRMDLFDSSVSQLSYTGRYYQGTINSNTGQLYLVTDVPTINLMDTISNQTAVIAK